MAEDCTLDPMDRLLAIAVAEHAGPSGEAWPSVGTLSRKTGMSERRVRSGLRTLCSGPHPLFTRAWTGRHRTPSYFVVRLPEELAAARAQRRDPMTTASDTNRVSEITPPGGVLDAADRHAVPPITCPDDEATETNRHRVPPITFDAKEGGGLFGNGAQGGTACHSGGHHVPLYPAPRAPLGGTACPQSPSESPSESPKNTPGKNAPTRGRSGAVFSIPRNGNGETDPASPDTHEGFAKLGERDWNAADEGVAKLRALLTAPEKRA